MSKKTNRTAKARRFRQAMKRGLDVGKRMTGRRINKHQYGAGIGRPKRGQGL